MGGFPAKGVTEGNRAKRGRTERGAAALGGPNVGGIDRGSDRRGPHVAPNLRGASYNAAYVQRGANDERPPQGGGHKSHYRKGGPSGNFGGVAFKSGRTGGAANLARGSTREGWRSGAVARQEARRCQYLCYNMSGHNGSYT